MIILSFSLIKLNIQLKIPEQLVINREHNFNLNELAQYTIDISTIQEENYIHLEIAGDNHDNNYVLSIVDDFEKQNRIQLSQSSLGNTNLILSKKQIKDNSINIIIECSDYSHCSGTLKNKILSKIPLIENKPFNYYNSIDNMIMEFSIISSSEILNIWARGDLEIETHLDGIEYNQYKNDNNFYITKNPNLNEITLKVTGKKGDLINVGFAGYIQKKVKNEIYYYLSSELTKDGSAITSYMNRKYANKYCYDYKNNIKENEEIYGTGIIFNKFLRAGPGSSEREDQKASKSSFNNGFIKLNELEKYQYICFNLENDDNETAYTFQIYSNNSINNKLNVFEPLDNGRFYAYRMKSSTKIALISKNSRNFENILYYLFSTQTSTNLYSIDCDNYPLCNLDDSVNKISSMKIGKLSSINLKKDEIYDFSPINKNQKLFVVSCDDNTEEYCEFISLINRDDKEVNIIDYDNFLGKYSLKNQIDKYKINYLLSYTNSGIYDFIFEINYFGGEIDILTDFPKKLFQIKLLI